MITWILISVFVVWFILYFAIGIFKNGLNDFLEKFLKKTLWIWLPFHAFKRLTREFREKYMK
jgi:F0F1-type ATP synthase membrane subunit a